LDDMERLGGLEAAAASVPHVLQELLTGVDTTGRCKRAPSNERLRTFAIK